MGVILFTLVCGKLPFNGKTYQEITKAIKECNPRIPIEEGVELTYGCRHFIGSLITYPKYRLSMDQIKEHPWFKGEEMKR